MITLPRGIMTIAAIGTAGQKIEADAGGAAAGDGDAGDARTMEDIDIVKENHAVSFNPEGEH